MNDKVAESHAISSFFYIALVLFFLSKTCRRMPTDVCEWRSGESLANEEPSISGHFHVCVASRVRGGSCVVFFFLASDVDLMMCREERNFVHLIFMQNNVLGEI